MGNGCSVQHCCMGDIEPPPISEHGENPRIETTPHSLSGWPNKTSELLVYQSNGPNPNRSKSRNSQSQTSKFFPKLVFLLFMFFWFPLFFSRGSLWESHTFVTRYLFLQRPPASVHIRGAGHVGGRVTQGAHGLQGPQARGQVDGLQLRLVGDLRSEPPFVRPPLGLGA